MLDDQSTLCAILDLSFVDKDVEGMNYHQLGQCAPGQPDLNSRLITNTIHVHTNTCPHTLAILDKKVNYGTYTLSKHTYLQSTNTHILYTRKFLRFAIFAFFAE